MYDAVNGIADGYQPYLIDPVADAAGVVLGRKVAHWERKHYFQPLVLTGWALVAACGAATRRPPVTLPP